MNLFKTRLVEHFDCELCCAEPGHLRSNITGRTGLAWLALIVCAGVCGASFLAPSVARRDIVIGLGLLFGLYAVHLFSYRGILDIEKGRAGYKERILGCWRCREWTGSDIFAVVHHEGTVTHTGRAGYRNGIVFFCISIRFRHPEKEVPLCISRVEFARFPLVFLDNFGSALAAHDRRTATASELSQRIAASLGLPLQREGHDG